MKQFLLKVVDELIESCILEDLSYKGKNYQAGQTPLIITTDVNSTEETITIKGKKYKFIKYKNEEDLTNQEGVYIFVAKEKFSFVIKDAFIKFASIRVEHNNIKVFYPCTPKINFFTGEKEGASDTITIEKGTLIYVGEAKNIRNRYQRHYSCHINKTSALKLGLRECIKNNVDFYYTTIENKDRSKLEKDIREKFSPRFGE